MSDMYFKARPSETPGRMMFEMDQRAAEVLERLIIRSTPVRQDNPSSHREMKDRALGAFMAGRAVMGWRKAR